MYHEKYFVNFVYIIYCLFIA